ncbi:MAG: DUF1573 domain-containing protein [Bacteroidota bacterium]
MKTIVRNILLFSALLMTGTLFAQQTLPAGTNPAGTTVAPAVDPAEAAPELTQIEFVEESYDFGKITQGEVVKHKFTLKNAGEYPLVLENVKPSCGCTALDWPREAIAPGESAEIEAQFNSAGKMGRQTKYITVVYNGNPKIERIMFQGEIVPKPKEPTYQSPPIVPANPPVEQ